jgi:ribosomal protein S18 acetylase RimI-like enzyme
MTDKFKIRDYSENDFNELNSLWESTDVGGAHRGDNKEVIRRTIECGGKLIILENNESGKIAGTSWLTCDNRRIYLHHFAVAKEFQGQKLSHILAKASIDYAKQVKMQIKLEVHESNTKAINLYKKHGFGYLGDYKVYIIRNIS